jgi:hypothetical protein
MSSSSDFELIHGQLHVTKDPSKPELLGRGNKAIHGATYLQSPTVVGKDSTFTNVEAALMVGPVNNVDSPIPWICDEKIKFIPKWEISPCGDNGVGADKYEEKLAHPYSLVVRAAPHTTNPKKCSLPSRPGSKTTPTDAAAMFIGDVDIYGYTRIKDKLSTCNDVDIKKNLNVEGKIRTGGSVKVGGDLIAAGEVKSQCGGHVLSAKKNFDISHPTKEGWRLTHTCVEGPEAAVYIRGRIKNITEIALPEYWKGLVDIGTITVNLTPIGAHQDLMVKRWDDERVYLQSKGGIPVDCFYHIMAERIDTEKLIVEYEGSIEDYPGDNSQRSIAGYHYDVK